MTLVFATDLDACPDADELRDAAVVSVPAWGHPSASLAGDSLGEFESEFAALEALRQAMNVASYWPNVYSINERGNVELMSYDARGGGWTVARGWV